METRLNFLDVPVALCMRGGFIIAIVITTGKVIWQKRRIAAAQWRFSGIRQVASVCT